jgi:hypothetical protein
MYIFNATSARNPTNFFCKEDMDYITTFNESLFFSQRYRKNAPPSRGAILW